MGETLSLDSILEVDQINDLFSDDLDEQDSPLDSNDSLDIGSGDTAEADTDTVIDDEPEIVGSGKDSDIEEKEDTNSVKDTGTSPKNNFYSSIAKALKEEGIFPDLEDNEVDAINAPEDFAEVFEKQIQAKLDERQKRIDRALNSDIEVSEIRKYESTLSYLDSIKDSHISDETDKGESLRKQLIYQDYINRGYSKERATREVQKSLNAGTDIDDAKEALISNKEFFQSEYNSLIKEAEEETNREIQERKEQAESLRKSILNEDKAFGEIQIDKSTRQKIFDNISKPVFKDPETGELYTAIQKYERENRIEFLKNVGLLFTLTNGFKSIDGLVKDKVKKQVKKGLRELEHTINNTARTSDGNLKYASGTIDDPESYLHNGWDLDI